MKSLFNFLFLFLPEQIIFIIILLIGIDFSLPDCNSVQEIFKSPYIEFYDDQNKLLYKTGDDLILIEVNLLPKHFIHALIAIEDKTFFQHKGINYLSLLKHLYLNLKSKKVIGGGSTISQQLAKNILQNQECFSLYDRTVLRKIKESILTYKLEQNFTKLEILYFYLNRVFFGKNCYGIEAAAKFYFKKSASSLNLYESALLAGILQSPSKYAGNLVEWKKRAILVLKRMRQLGYITIEEEKKMKSFKMPKIITDESNINYFINYVLQNLPPQFKDKDLKIYTTFNRDLYEKANKSLQYTQEHYGMLWNSDEASFVFIEQNGAIKVLIGGLNYLNSNFNIATQAKRPAGSVAKYFTYLTAMEMGLNPQSFVNDSPYEFGSWQPSNYLHPTRGEVSIQAAFAQSVNSVAIRILEIVQPKNVIHMIRRLGINDPIKENLSLTLGGINTSLFNLTQSFLPVINQGMSPKPFCIRKIEDSRTNKTLYIHEDEYTKIFDERTAYYMWTLLKATIGPYATGRKLNIQNKNFGGKSGTSNENKDLYFILCNKSFCIGCWFGKRNFEPMTHYDENLTIIALNHFFEQIDISDENIQFNLEIGEENTKTLLELI